MIEPTAADIARALGGHKHAGYWTAKCPAHDDHSPSLSISESSDGLVLVKCFSGCSQEAVLDALRARGLWAEKRSDIVANSNNKPKPATKPKHAARTTGDNARQIWRETLDPRATWAEDYLASRKLRLPADPEILLRTLRFHPRCPFPDRTKAPALIAGFTPIWTEVPDDPFEDPPPLAIHRIRGRGAGNKFMLGPVKGCAVMVSPWWHVHEHLHVCEGIETALALYAEGAEDDPDDCYRPIWALGSAGAIERFPVISRVRRLVIWTDHDASGTGLTAARECAGRWVAAGKRAVIRYPDKEGHDYAD